jgi:hydrogenase-4 component B
VRIPPPGDMAPASFHVSLQDFAWRFIYTPIGRGVEALAERLNYLQYMTIRRYLSLVFSALVILLIVLASWP